MIGYHCTPTKNINSIKKNGFQINLKPELPGDLGSGVYFFVNLGTYNNAKAMALKFGKQYRSGKNHNVPLSLIIVKFNDDNIIDMRDIKSKELFDENRKENISIVEEKFASLKKKIRRYSGGIKRGNLDGYIFDIMKSTRPKVSGFIKDTYTPVDMKGYKRSSFPNGIECCIYNTDIIRIVKIENI